jgi:hypothetical protein
LARSLRPRMKGWLAATATRGHVGAPRWVAPPRPLRRRQRRHAVPCGRATRAIGALGGCGARTRATRPPGGRRAGWLAVWPGLACVRAAGHARTHGNAKSSCVGRVEVKRSGAGPLMVWVPASVSMRGDLAARGFAGHMAGKGTGSHARPERERRRIGSSPRPATGPRAARRACAGRPRPVGSPDPDRGEARVRTSDQLPRGTRRTHASLRLQARCMHRGMHVQQWRRSRGWRAGAGMRRGRPAPARDRQAMCTYVVGTCPRVGTGLHAW